MLSKDIEQDATDMICEHLASQLVWTENITVRLVYWKALKGVCYELNVNPKHYVFAARKDRLERDTKRQSDGKNKARRPSSLMRHAKMFAEDNTTYIAQRYEEARNYRERLVKGYYYA
jgi:hypothetical protein